MIVGTSVLVEVADGRGVHDAQRVEAVHAEFAVDAHRVRAHHAIGTLTCTGLIA